MLMVASPGDRRSSSHRRRLATVVVCASVNTPNSDWRLITPVFCCDCSALCCECSICRTCFDGRKCGVTQVNWPFTPFEAHLCIQSISSRSMASGKTISTSWPPPRGSRTADAADGRVVRHRLPSNCRRRRSSTLLRRR